MFNDDRRLRRIAFALSVFSHVLLLLLLRLPEKTLVITPVKEDYKIPVELVKLKKPLPPKPKKPIKKKQTPLNKKAGKKKVKKDTAPKRLPGDRDRPVLASSVTPVYPKSALNYELTGTITVDFMIDPNGDITSYNVVESTGHVILDTAFIRTITTYATFQPRRVIGKNLPGTIRLKYQFSLSDD